MPVPLSPDVSKPVTAKTADDINDLFKTLDNEEQIPPEKKEPKKDKDDEEEIPPEPDDDVELVEPDEEEPEKLDLSKTDEEIDIEAPPRKKEILKEYPEIFKKFPFIEKMLYRDKQYNELFGSFDDAKEIAEKSEIFNQFESQLLSGDTTEILKNVKEVDENAFHTLVDEYLPALHKVDKEAYQHVTGNLNRRLIMEMVEEANDLERADPDKSNLLKEAALIVNQFVFGNSKFIAPFRLTEASGKDNKNNEVEQERLSLVKERFETSRDELQGKVDNTLRATISSYIDPKGVMSPYVKKNAVADAMKILSSSIASDSSTVKNLDRLWRSAFDAKFSRDSLGKIQSYYLSKAKGNLKNAIMKARAEALKDNSNNSRRSNDETEEEPSRRPARIISAGKPSQPKGKNEMKKGESVSDFFMRD